MSGRKRQTQELMHLPQLACGRKEELARQGRGGGGFATEFIASSDSWLSLVFVEARVS